MISNPFTDPKWANKTLALIDQLVGFVRDKTTRPLANLIRGIVFGLIAIVAGLLVFVLFLIGLARGVQEFLDIWMSRPNAVWVSYFILSAIFVGAGAMLMRKRHPYEKKSKQK